MRTPHLCWVQEAPSVFAPLVASARELGLRVGWLQLAPFAPLPELESSVGAGMARCIAVGGGASVALKPIAGTPVLRDLLREHFLGFRLVLVSGDPAAPGVRIDAGLEPFRLWRCLSGPAVGAEVGSAARWRLRSPAGREWTLTSEQLLARLARPRLGPRVAGETS